MFWKCKTTNKGSHDSSSNTTAPRKPIADRKHRPKWARKAKELQWPRLQTNPQTRITRGKMVRKQVVVGEPPQLQHNLYMFCFLLFPKFFLYDIKNCRSFASEFQGCLSLVIFVWLGTVLPGCVIWHSIIDTRWGLPRYIFNLQSLKLTSQLSQNKTLKKQQIDKPTNKMSTCCKIQPKKMYLLQISPPQQQTTNNHNNNHPYQPKQTKTKHPPKCPNKQRFSVKRRVRRGATEPKISNPPKQPPQRILQVERGQCKEVLDG